MQDCLCGVNNLKRQVLRKISVLLLVMTLSFGFTGCRNVVTNEKKQLYRAICDPNIQGVKEAVKNNKSIVNKKMKVFGQAKPLELAVREIETEKVQVEICSELIEAGAVTIDGCVQAVGSDGTLLGYVITVTPHNGYSGDITFSLGVQLDGTLNGYSITSISETAGLGMKAQEEAFYSQFENKKVETFTVTKTGSTDDSQIDAISGATITSSAVTDGVNAGLAYYRDLLQTTGGELLNE